MIKIAPSILSADFAFLYDEIKKVEKVADLLHIDVMDGHFVPNITLGPPVIAKIKERTSLPLDVHLMIENPEKYIDDFIAAGADVLTFHVEATSHHHRLLNYIKTKGAIPSVALNPSTSLTHIEYILPMTEMILIMTVNPGFGGQKFIPYMKYKVTKLKEMIHSKNLDISIEVDGGINEQTAKDIVLAGADILVAGSFIYNAENPVKAIKKLKNINSNQ